jgi:hypothetical protein
MKANLLALRLISFVLLTLIWKEFPLWLYPRLEAGCVWVGIIIERTRVLAMVLARGRQIGRNSADRL